MPGVKFDVNQEGENQRAKKAHTPLTSSTLTLATSYLDVPFGTDQIIDVGGAPWVTFMGHLTPGSATTITYRVLVSHDGVVFAPAPILTAQSGASGDSNAYPHEVTYAVADWTDDEIPLEARANGWRFWKLQAKVDSITGTPTLAVDAAAGNDS